MKFLETVKKIFTKHIPLKLVALALAVAVVIVINAV